MTDHASKVQAARWAELQRALGYLKNAEFEMSRDITGWLEHDEQREAVLMWLGDLRRSLGVLALVAGDGPDAESFVELLERTHGDAPRA